MTNSLVKWLNYDMVCAPKAYISFINANQFHHSHIIFPGIKMYHVPSSLFTHVFYALIYELQSMTYVMVLLAQWKKNKVEEEKVFQQDLKCEIPYPQLPWIKTPGWLLFTVLDLENTYMHAYIHSYKHPVVLYSVSTVSL